MTGALGRDLRWAALARIVSAVAPLIVVNRLVAWLGVESYAQWATLISVLGWIAVADLGLGFGLRNAISREIGAGWDRRSGEQASRTLAGCIQGTAIISLVLGIALAGFVCWSPVDIIASHRWTVLCLYGGSLAMVPLALSSSALQGMQAAGQQQLAGALGTMGYAIVLVVCSMLIPVHAIPWWLAPLTLASMVAPHAWAWHRVGTRIDAGRHLLDWSCLRMALPLVRIGIRVFILQICTVVLFGTGTAIVYACFDHASVAAFDLMGKLYLFGMTTFNGFLFVYWTEISVALGRRDRQALDRAAKHLQLMAAACAIGAFAAVPIVPWLVHIWGGGRVHVEPFAAWPFAAMSAIQALAYAHSVFLNAAERINGQIALATCAALGMLPVSMALMSFPSLGVGAVPLASALLTLPSLAYAIRQSRAIRHSITP